MRARPYCYQYAFAFQRGLKHHSLLTFSMDSRIWACLQRTAKLITLCFEFYFSCEVKPETDLSNICTICGFLTLMQCTLAAPCKEYILWSIHETQHYSGWIDSVFRSSGSLWFWNVGAVSSELVMG